MSRKTIERNISYDEARNLYYVYQDYGRDEEGRRVRKYRTCATLPDARRELHCFEADRVRQKLIVPSTVTLGQWLEYWFQEIVVPGRAVSTAYGYHGIIKNHLLHPLGEICLQELRPLHIQRHYTRMLTEKGLSPNTVRRHHDLLSVSLRMAEKQGLIQESPMHRVSPPRQVRTEPHFYTPENLKALYAAVEHSWLEPVVKLAGLLGLRREEICGLRWISVDFERRRLNIREARTTAGGQIVQKETKNTSSVRVLYLPDSLYDLLRRERQQQDCQQKLLGSQYENSGHVVVNPYGRPYSPNIISRSFARFICRHNLPKITLHGLRHTFATVASAQGVPLFEISRALGHSSTATTGRIYTHLIDQAQTTAISSVAAAVQ